MDKTDPDYWRSRLSVPKNKYPTRSGPGGKGKYIKSFQQRMKKINTYSEPARLELGGHSPRERELHRHLKRASEYVEAPAAYDMSATTT